jgi:hypothetical protein
MKNFLEKNYKLLAGLILGFMLIVSLINAWWDGAIFDETAHIPASYSYVTKHEIRLNPEHPPLIKDLAGLPLLFLNLNFDTDQPFWAGTLPGKWDEGQWEAGRYLLYQAGNNPDKIIFWARFPIVLLSLILGWFIFRWVRELAGITAGLFALALYAFDPNILGHNHFVTTDVGIAAFMTFSFYYYLKFIKSPTWKNVALAGVFVGLLMLAKFSFIIALPIFALATFAYPLVIHAKPGEKRILVKLKKLGEYIGKGAMIFGISLVVVWTVYAANTFNMTKETVSQTIDNNFSPADTANPKNAYTNKALHWLNGNSVTRPLTEFGIGIGYVFRRVAGGNGAYFMQQVSGKAFPAYFPTVFAIKEPLPSLFLMLTALFISLSANLRSFWEWLKAGISEKASSLSAYIRHNIVSISMLSFIVLYSYISITGNLNIGFRHLFPILPFIYVLTAKTIFGLIRRMDSHAKLIWGVMLAAMTVFLMSETVAAYPAYMSYFNEIAGGPKNGYKYVTDSNADWGQDIKRLKVWIERYNWCDGSNDSFCKIYDSEKGPIEKIRINYFGGGDIKHYFGDKAIDWWDSKRPLEPGWYAISTNYLQGSLYDTTKKDSESYRWIKNIKPVDQVGTSIFVYYITDQDISGIK